MATSPDVATLEREAAEARARFAETLDRLTSPQTGEAVKQELTDYALGVKHSILGSGRSRAHSLKDRALGNPLGLLMIGAGIGWRLYRHPPIASLLVGTGIAMLMKGNDGRRLDASAYRDPYDPAQPRGYVPGGVAGYGYPVAESPPGGFVERAGAAVSHAGYVAQDVKARSLDAAHHLAERVSDTAHAVAEQVTGAAAAATTSVLDAAEAARASAIETTEAARAAAGDAAEATREAVMGAVDTARTAVAGAADAARSTTSDAMQRGADAVSQARAATARGAGQAADLAQRNPLLLGALGIAAGTALMYALRSAESRDDAGDRRPVRRGRHDDSWSRAGGRSATRHQRPARPSSRDDRDSAGRGATAAGLASSATDMASNVASGAGRIVGAASDAVAASASGAYGAASSAARSAADAAYAAARRAPQAPVYLQDQIAELGERYPLLLGAVSIAVGAAVGGALRLSESENRLMGPLSDRLKQRAWEAAEEQYGLAREAAEHFAGDLQTRFAGDGEHGRPADFGTAAGGGQQHPGSGPRSTAPSGTTPSGTAP